MEKVIYVVNLFLAFLIMRFEYNSSNDKTIVIASLFYVVLVVFNLIFGFFAQMDKKSHFKHYYYSALLLVAISVLSGLVFSE